MKEINVTMNLNESYSFKEHLDKYFTPDEIAVVDNLSRYNLGGNKIPSNCGSLEKALDEYIENAFPGVDKECLLIFPIYAHIHGDIQLSLGELSDPWDSGIAGYVIIHPFLNGPIMDEDIEEIKEYLQKTIEEFNKRYADWIIEIELKYPVKEKSERYYCEILKPSIYYYGPEPYDVEEQFNIIKNSHFYSKIKRKIKTEDEELKKLIVWNTKY